MGKADTIRMKDVAERAGVSVMTVSLVLRGGTSGDRISDETRRRVLDATRDLQYRPSALGRALRSGQTNILGLYAGYGYINVRLPFFTEIVSGLQEGCERVQKDLLLHGIFHGTTVEDIYNELADGRIDGLIVNIAQDNPLAERLRVSQLPAVAIADSIQGVPSVIVDEAEGGRILAQHLAERGHKRVVYFNSPLGVTSAIQRFSAFCSAAAILGMSVEEVPLHDSLRPDDTIITDLLGRANKPTAAVCWIAGTAYDLIANCKAHEIRIPADLTIVAFDGHSTPQDAIWSLSAVRAPWAQVARTAVLLLDSVLKGESVPEQTILPLEFIPGSTS